MAMERYSLGLYIENFIPCICKQQHKHKLETQKRQFVYQSAKIRS